MSYLQLRHRARQLWPSHLPNSQRNRTAWLRAVARLGDRWLLAQPVRRAQS